MFYGLLLSIAACMVWGIAYVVPLILADMRPIRIALFRYLIFSVFCMGYLCVKRKELTFTKTDWRDATLLGIIGNLAFYWVLSEAVVRIGAAMTGVFTAYIPVVVSLWVLLTEKRRDAWNPKLLLGLGMIAVGLIFLNMDRVQTILTSAGNTLATIDHDSSKALWDYALGIVFALASVVIWTWFPLKNTKWLTSHASSSVSVWTAAQGATLFPIALVALGFNATTSPRFLMPDLRAFLWISVLALGCSWLGNFLWNAASRYLPTMMIGQILVFETIAAIVYASILDQALPSLTMVIGSIVVLVGVSISFQLLRRQNEQS